MLNKILIGQTRTSDHSKNSISILNSENAVQYANIGLCIIRWRVVVYRCWLIAKRHLPVVDIIVINYSKFRRCKRNVVGCGFVRVVYLIKLKLIMAATGFLFRHAAFATLVICRSKKFHAGLTAHAVMQFHRYSRRNSHVNNCQYADIYLFHLQYKITTDLYKYRYKGIKSY